ncbi:MAG TPA: class I adenylate-forming enzyme family protein [Polyangia bacterium]|nr:class I adenylate-forming enzyme family protein [Polyangia bacterium]
MKTSLEDFPALLLRLHAGDRAAPALSFHRGRKLAGSLAYGELVDRVERAAATLHRMGVRIGDRVALASPNGLDLPVWMLAVWRVGAVAVPLNPNASNGDWKLVLEHAGVRGLIAAPELADAPAAAGLGFVRSFDEGCGPLPTTPTPMPPGIADEAAIILYTSGTTGLPKGVTLSQRNLLANAQGMAAAFRLAHATQLAVLPLFHAHALGFGFLSALVSGGHLVLGERFDPLAWGELVRTHAASWASVTPHLLPLLMEARVHRRDLPSLRGLLVSSAPLGSDLARRFEETTAIPLVHGWGLSEFTNFACVTDPWADEATRLQLFWGDEVPSVGSPIGATEVSVRGEWGERRVEGERGELCVRGRSRMLSYWDDANATERVMYGDWLRTGDQGYFRMVGGRACYYVSGRIKEIVIRGGEKHSPVALENRLLAAMPELAGHVVVLGFPHALVGEELGAYVELDPLPEELQARLMAAVDGLPADARPKIILHGREPIPRTHTGKVQRKKLAPLFAGFRDCIGRPRLEPLS